MVELVSSPLGDGSQPPPVDIDTLYFEAVGGEKRRRVKPVKILNLHFSKKKKKKEGKTVIYRNSPEKS